MYVYLRRHILLLHTGRRMCDESRVPLKEGERYLKTDFVIPSGKAPYCWLVTSQFVYLVQLSFPKRFQSSFTPSLSQGHSDPGCPSSVYVAFKHDGSAETLALCLSWQWTHYRHFKIETLKVCLLLFLCTQKACKSEQAEETLHGSWPVSCRKWVEDFKALANVKSLYCTWTVCWGSHVLNDVSHQVASHKICAALLFHNSHLSRGKIFLQQSYYCLNWVVSSLFTICCCDMSEIGYSVVFNSILFPASNRWLLVSVAEKIRSG